MEGILSQEEIDALLGGSLDEEPEEKIKKTNKIQRTIFLTKEEEDAIGEVGNISLGSSSTALSTLLGKNVSITTPKVKVLNFGDLKAEVEQGDKVLIQIEYKTGFSGMNMLLMEKRDALIIGDLMMGKDGSDPPDELSDLYLSAVGESMNQMMGSAATSLAGMFGKSIDINPPDVKVTSLNDIGNGGFFASNPEFVTVIFDMEIEGLINTHIYQIMNEEFVKKITKEMYEMGMEEEPKPQQNQTSQQQQPQMQQGQMQNNQNMGGGYQQFPPNMMNGYQQQGMMGYPQPQQQGNQNMMGGYYQQPVNVQPVEFASFGGGGMERGLPSNIDLIMDVPLEVTVELGRTKKQIKEILDLGAGSIVELDKLAGEPVDVRVNGKLIAKGEVVVIDESFGVRITDIVSKIERLNKVQ